MARDVREEELVKQVLATALPEWRNPAYLSRGSFGVTYRVKHVDGKPYAVLKVFRPDAGILKTFAKENVLERFAREVKVLQSISHPRIPKLLAHGLRNDPPWFLMQFCPGPNIEMLVDNGELLREEAWFGVARDLLEALRHAHSKGAIHKDLNPGNVILTPQGATLIDFGVAALVQDAYSPYHITMNSPIPFLSPEQLHFGQVTGKSDIFSLASLLVFAGTGHIPWRAADYDEMKAQIINGAPDYSGLSKAQQRLLAVMHEKSHAQRATSDQALALLDSLFSPATVVASRPKAQPQVYKPRDKKATFGAAKRVGDRLQEVAQKLEEKEALVQERKVKQLKIKLRAMTYLRPLIGFFSGLFVISAPVVSGYWAFRSRPSRILRNVTWLQFATWIVLLFLTATGTDGQASSASVLYIMLLNAVLGTFAGVVRSMKVEGLPLAFAVRGSSILTPAQIREHRQARGLPVFVPEQRHVEADTQVPGSDSSGAEDFVLETQPLFDWDSVKSSIMNVLEQRAGRQFVIEIDSRDIDGIFFQGYSEENGLVTMEAAASLSVRPPVNNKQHAAMIKLGWEPPSDGLPNYIRFLDSAESNVDYMAEFVIRTLRDGYGITLDSIAVS